MRLAGIGLAKQQYLFLLSQSMKVHQNKTSKNSLEFTVWVSWMIPIFRYRSIHLFSVDWRTQITSQKRFLGVTLIIPLFPVDDLWSYSFQPHRFCMNSGNTRFDELWNYLYLVIISLGLPISFDDDHWWRWGELKECLFLHSFKDFSFLFLSTVIFIDLPL